MTASAYDGFGLVGLASLAKPLFTGDVCNSVASLMHCKSTPITKYYLVVVCFIRRATNGARSVGRVELYSAVLKLNWNVGVVLHYCHRVNKALVIINA